MRRKVQGYKTPEQRRADNLARYHRKKAESVKSRQPLLVTPQGYAMKRARKGGRWLVAPPPPEGETRRRWISTGEKDHQTALKVIAASGLERLLILSKAKCLTHDAIAVISAGDRVSCRDVIQQWMADMQMDRAEKTALDYYYHVGVLVERCGCEKKPVVSITRQQLYDFVNDVTLKESSRGVRLAAIRSFYRHAAGYGHVLGNIADTIRINPALLTVEQREVVPATPFTEPEYRHIMSNGLVPQFWRWASALGWWLGLRLVDVCNYEVASMGDDFAVLYPHKTGRRLVLPLHDPLIGSGELRGVFAEVRMAAGKSTYCFPEARDMYQQHRILNYKGGFAEAVALCGIKGKSFHGLRHSFKVRLMASGKSIEEIAALMGHADIKVTEGYGRSG